MTASVSMWMALMLDGNETIGGVCVALDMKLCTAEFHRFPLSSDC